MAGGKGPLHLAPTFKAMPYPKLIKDYLKQTKLIVGLGSGRCGTVSLSRFFRQKGVYTTHEVKHLPWYKPDPAEAVLALARVLRRADGRYPFVADVAFYWLKYVPWLIERIPEVRCVCLKRDQHETVMSFMQKLASRNYWTARDSEYWEEGKWKDNPIEEAFPKYDLPKKQALFQYWEDYYVEAAWLQKMFPDNFRILEMRYALNSEYGQNEMLTFCGLKGQNLEPAPEPNLIQFSIERRQDAT